MKESYWGQDPAMLFSEVAPGFFATNDSGNGIGYSYFTIRGFGQARTRVSLDGAPLNDAESGELFFIDLADFLTTAGDVQIQRGVFGLSGLGRRRGHHHAHAVGGRPSFTLEGGAGSYGTRALLGRCSTRASSAASGPCRLATRGSRPTATATSRGSTRGTTTSPSPATASARACASSSSVGPRTRTSPTRASRSDVLEGGLTGDADEDRRSEPHHLARRGRPLLPAPLPSSSTSSTSRSRRASRRRSISSRATATTSSSVAGRSALRVQPAGRRAARRHRSSPSRTS